MVELNFHLAELIERLPKINSVFKSAISVEDETLYPSIEELEASKRLFLLDSFFKALDDCLLKPKSDATSSQLRNLIKKIDYDSELYPRFDYCVYDRIIQGISFQKLNQSRKEDNIIRKEQEFIEMLFSTLRTPNEKFPWIVSMFILYIFNKISHFMDKSFTFIYDKSCRLYPNMFILLNRFNKNDSPEKTDRFIFVAKTLCSTWSSAIYEDLSQKISIEQKNNANHVYLCLKEVQSLPCMQNFYDESLEIKLILDCWDKTKNKLKLFSQNTIDFCYYQLISEPNRTFDEFANFSPDTQNYLEEEIASIPFLVDYLIEREDYLHTHPDSQELFKQDQAFGEEILEDLEEVEWRRNNRYGKNPFQYNPFSPSIAPEIVPAAMAFQNDCGMGSFGCPLRLFQLPVGEIENILFDVLSLREIRRCRESLLAEKFLYDDPKLPYDERKRLLQDRSLQYREIRNEEKSALKELGEYPRAFYQIASYDERYILWLTDVIPFEKGKDKISPFAMKDGYLHIVYRQSMKRWFSILRLFCKVSYGKNTLSNSDAILQCFETGCHGNKEHYCHKRLSKILHELNDVPSPVIDISQNNLE